VEISARCYLRQRRPVYPWQLLGGNDNISLLGSHEWTLFEAFISTLAELILCLEHFMNYMIEDSSHLAILWALYNGYHY
jgi:hypothetical protein